VAFARKSIHPNTLSGGTTRIGGTWSGLKDRGAMRRPCLSPDLRAVRGDKRSTESIACGRGSVAPSPRVRCCGRDSARTHARLPFHSRFVYPDRLSSRGLRADVNHIDKGGCILDHLFASSIFPARRAKGDEESPTRPSRRPCPAAFAIGIQGWDAVSADDRTEQFSAVVPHAGDG
jgi:hypothetical protein